MTPRRWAPALWLLTGHAVRSFGRNPVAAFFTLVFPLAFLIIVATAVGGQDTGGGVPVSQFLVAPFAVFGVAQASFVLVAVDTAVLRDSGVLLRLRSAPVPAWTVPGSRIGASMVASGAAVLLLTVVAVLGYGVTPVWRKLPALLVTLVLGIGCCAALGLALASLTRTALVTQTLAQGLLITLAFVSDVFIVGADLPRWLDVTGSLLPLKHFARAMAEVFDPSAGAGFSPGHLAVLVLWTVAGVLVTRSRFTWQPRGAATAGSADTARGTAGSRPVRTTPAALTVHHRRSPGGLLPGQVGYALLGLRRDPLSVFFSIVFPALLLALFPTVFGGGPMRGMPMAQYMFAGMIAYTTAVAAYVDMPESVVAARAAGVLKRLRGTPLPMRWYFTGRVVAALLVSLIAAVVLTVVGAGFLGVRLTAVRVPALLLAIGAGSACFAAVGLAVAALMPAARSVLPVTLGTLLPLCFVSEVFVVGDAPLPGWLTAIADVLPLRHLLRAVLAAADPAATGSGIAAGHLGVLVLWTALASLVVWRRRTALS